jgi:NitT/TauT family transport system substrate-binding protein
MSGHPALVLGLAIGLVAACATPGAGPGSAARAVSGPAPPAAPEAAPAGRPALEKVQLALPSVSGVFAPHVLAQQKGFFREEGLEVDLPVLRTNLVTAGLASGEVDYAGSFGPMVRDALAGMPIRVLAATVDKSTRVLMGAPGVTSLAQLRGGTIAVSVVGSGPYNSGVLALQHFGIDPYSEVTWVPAGTPSERVLAVQQGAAQASIFSGSEIPRAEALGLVTLLRLDEVAPLPESGLSTNPQRIATQRDQVKRALRALVRALQVLKTDREAGIQVFMDYLKLSREDAGPAYDAIVWAYSDDGTVSEAALRFTIESEKQVLQIANEVSPDRVADFGPLHEVLREQGISPGPDRAR